MKGIYLASHKASHPNYDLLYQDITGLRDIDGCMLEVDLHYFDYIIATPPCNYYSRANYRRDESEYSLKTKHLLPEIIDKLLDLNKPFIVENVRNFNMFQKKGLFKPDLIIFEWGRHTYWTNVDFNYLDIPQYPDDIQNTASVDRQGGNNVHLVIERFLEVVNNEKY